MPRQTLEHTILSVTLMLWIMCVFSIFNFQRSNVVDWLIYGLGVSFWNFAVSPPIEHFKVGCLVIYLLYKVKCFSDNIIVGIKDLLWKESLGTFWKPQYKEEHSKKQKFPALKQIYVEGWSSPSPEVFQWVLDGHPLGP